MICRQVVFDVSHNCSLPLLTCYDRALELNPTNEIVSNNRSIAYSKLGSSHVDTSSENWKDNKIKYYTSDGKLV